MTTFDHLGNNASPEWLTSVLTHNGFLRSGVVIDLKQRVSEIGETLTSNFFFLHEIRYSPNHEGNPPSDCLLKVGKPHRFGAAKNEAKFYDLARKRGPTDALLTSFGSAVDEVTQSAVILLEVRRDTRPIPEWPLPPSMSTSERAVRALADVHASSWNSPELKPQRRNRIVKLIDDAKSDLLGPFFDLLGDGLSAAHRTLLEQLCEQLPRVLQSRIDATNTQTLVHGDAHFWNFLYPKDESKVAIVIDWQTQAVHFGAWDLAYMIGLHWFPERRKRFEQVLLDVYHAQLQTHEINYSYEDLWYDYRLQIAGQAFVPIVQWSSKVPASVWWPHVDRAFCAFDDLDCREFLE